MGAKKREDAAASREIERLKAEIELLTGTSTDVVYRLRYDGMKYEYVSPSVTRLIGFSREELEEMGLRSLILETRVVGEALQPVLSFEPYERSRARGEVLKWQADYLMKTKDGRKVWVSDVSYPWFDASGAIIGSLGTLRDISDRVAAEERARALVASAEGRDKETSLPLRAAFFERLGQECQRAQRGGRDVSVVVASGQGAASLPIKEYAAFLTGALRGTDSVARTGERECASILCDTGIEGAFAAASRLEKAGGPAGESFVLSAAAAGFDKTLHPERLYQSAKTRQLTARHEIALHLALDENASVH